MSYDCSSRSETFSRSIDKRLSQDLGSIANMQLVEKYTFGVGDRFAHQAMAQLRAFQTLLQAGVAVHPVWNKSNREHNFIGSEPSSVLESARQAVANLDWKLPWYVDADHIQLATVDRFLDSSNFFTIDVADSIGKPASTLDIDQFVKAHPELIGEIPLQGLAEPVLITESLVRSVASKYLLAAQEAGRIYQHIASRKDPNSFITEVSMDETDSPQTPPELLIILAALADQKVPLQTVAPKFTGRFNKGVDYVGDLRQFRSEFLADLAVIRFAIERYPLPKTLKLSVHSGSDKFSLYPIIRQSLQETGAGIHLKTAGTTWLEEMIGLAEAGGDGLQLANEIYAYAIQHIDALCQPYASVIDIDRTRLPTCQTAASWTGPEFASTLRHIPGNPWFNPSVRQLLHVSFKIAAKEGDRYLDLLKSNERIVGEQVTANIYDRHLKPLFIG
jgi:tagaturonate epimerase